MIKTYQYKLYPNASQIKTLAHWLLVCCRIYNHALAHRTKAYKRRGVSVSYTDQQSLLTKQRARSESLRSVPCHIERAALRRVDCGFKAFFRRLKAGQNPGFPRFRSWRRYNSLEYLSPGTYLKDGKIRIPCMGVVRCRGRSLPEGMQIALRILRRPTGWYAQIVLNDGRRPSVRREVTSAIGVDVGLSAFATLSDGTKIDNPRWLFKSARKLRALHRRVSRRKNGTGRRRRAVNALARRHDVVASQRKSFCHEQSTMLVRKYDMIAVEDLNVAGMVRSRFGKSILDAAWAQFTKHLAAKAEYAGRQVVFVNARGTSQECPNCGAIKPKTLSERIHQCACGCECDRDHAAAQVILARALAGKRGESRVERPSAGQRLSLLAKLGSAKRVRALVDASG